MPGPPERVVLDLDLVAVLVRRLVTLRDLLWSWHGRLAAAPRPVGDPAGVVICALARASGWAQAAAEMLTRRVALARSAEAAAGLPAAAPRPRLARFGQDRREAPSGRVVAVTLPADPFHGDRAAARAAGRRLGERLVAAVLRPAPDMTELAALTAELRASALDPDLTDGLVTAVGPGRLAELLHVAEGIAGGDARHRARRPPRSRAPELAALTAALGTALGTVSRTGRLTASWFGRFNVRGQADAAETSLLAPLLAGNRFAPATLRMLGEALFGGTSPAGQAGPDGDPVGSGMLGAADVPAPGGRDGDRHGRRPRPAERSGAGEPRPTVGPVRDVGLFGSVGPGGAGQREAYAVALLRAIADEPTLVASFATAHVPAVVALARALPAPRLLGATRWPSAAITDAWYDLLGRAGGERVRRADPAGAATFVARLAFAVYQEPERPLSPALLARIAAVPHVWREEMYASVTGLLPAADALRDPATGGLVASWPAAGPWATHLPGPVDAARVPAELWAALLRESLASAGTDTGLATVGRLARDAAELAAADEEATWAATRGYRGDGHTAYPASPRDLGALRRSAMLGFFVGAAADAAEELARADLAAVQRRAHAAERAIDQLAAALSAVQPHSGALANLWSIITGVTLATAVSEGKWALRARPTAEALAVIARVRAAVSVAVPGWQDDYVASALAVWRRRADDPLLPVEVTGPDGLRRRFTGDPRADGFVTGPHDDFLDPAGNPRDPAAMSPAQRDAFQRWLASPALVANNDAIPAPRPGAG